MCLFFQFPVLRDMSYTVHPHQMLEGLAGAVDDVTLGIESDRCLLDPQFELRALIGYVDMFTCETSFPYSAQRSK